ncbi:MAG: YmdB family metallophosphoesterase [Pseudonocardiaceae bacterium]
MRQRLGLNWVVVNAENCAVTGPNPMTGFGMTIELVDMLLEAGVDVITGGNHSWDGPHVAEALARPEVVRPHNVAGSLGRGLRTVGSGDRTLTVVNLLSPSAALPGMLAPLPSPIWPGWTALAAEPLEGAVLVDLHGESAWEKASFATAVDGQVAAVLGTHTHDPTLRAHLLPGGTAFVTEVGMTGRLGFTGGGFGDLTLGAIHLTLTDGRATTVSRIS